LYSFVPFVLLTIINILLLIDLHKKSRVSIENSNISKNQVSINVSVILMTLLFIVFTCPSAIASQYYQVLVMSFTGNILLSGADCLAFSFHAFNIFILGLSNKEFLRRLKNSVNNKSNSVHTAQNTSNMLV
jgi:hypothetical protein